MNTQNNNEDTALIRASVRDHTDVVRVLLDGGQYLFQEKHACVPYQQCFISILPYSCS